MNIRILARQHILYVYLYINHYRMNPEYTRFRFVLFFITTEFEHGFVLTSLNVLRLFKECKMNRQRDL